MLTSSMEGVRSIGAMNTIADIFNTLGGTTATAKALEVKLSAASEMKRRGSIPVRYWPLVIEALEGVGSPVSYEQLVVLHTDRETA